MIILTTHYMDEADVLADRVGMFFLFFSFLFFSFLFFSFFSFLFFSFLFFSSSFFSLAVVDVVFSHYVQGKITMSWNDNVFEKDVWNPLLLEY